MIFLYCPHTVKTKIWNCCLDMNFLAIEYESLWDLVPANFFLDVLKILCIYVFSCFTFKVSKL